MKYNFKNSLKGAWSMLQIFGIFGLLVAFLDFLIRTFGEPVAAFSTLGLMFVAATIAAGFEKETK